MTISSDSNRDAKPRWVQVAHIWRPRGNKGEVVAELLTDFPERFSNLQEVYLGKGGNEPHSRGLQRFWIDRNHPSQGIFHFAGSASISDAETLRGYDVFLPWEQRVELPAGKYFVTDLVGCAVFEVSEQQAPRVLGTVRDVQFTGEGVAGTPLLEIDTLRGELLVPLAEDICERIDTAARRIDVRLPEGLKDLNTPE